MTASATAGTGSAVYARVALADTPRQSRMRTTLWCGASMLLALLWLTVVARAYQGTGLFRWLGADFGFFWAAGRAVLADGVGAAYDFEVFSTQFSALDAFHSSEVTRVRLLPTPYPPVFYLAVTPFSALDPVVALAVWTTVNVGLAVFVAARLSERLAVHGVPRLAGVLSVLSFFPLASAFLVGQPIFLLLLAVFLAYEALERGQDLRAGLWVGVLLLKPQYAIFLLLSLALKRRWHALVGAGLAGGAIALSSVLLLGWEGLGRMAASGQSLTGFRLDAAGERLFGLEYMISWRALFALTLPAAASEQMGLALTAGVSILSVLMLMPVWRGPWQPGSATFHRQMLTTLVVTMLAGFHTFAYSASMLLVPAVALVGAIERRGAEPWLALLALLVPSFYYTLTLDAPGAGWLLTFVMVVVLGMVFYDSAIRYFREERPAVGSPAPS